MEFEELERTYYCHSAIGNSLDLKKMMNEVLQTVMKYTHSVCSGFYLKGESGKSIHLISRYGEIETSIIGNLLEYDSFCCVQKSPSERVIVFPLSRGLLVFIYRSKSIGKHLLRSLFQGMEHKLNISIEACLKVELLEEKNKKLKTLAKELAAQRYHLMDSNKFKDIFLANMSHELKTPLNSILVISSVMMKNKEKKLNDAQMRNLKIINDCGNDLLFLINDVLDISKLEAGEMLLELESIDIVKTLMDLKEMFEPLMKNKGLDFVCELDASVDFIYTDVNRVRQIIKNLLSNALKFVNVGKIRLKLEKDSDSIKIIVKDDGIGIAQNKLEHIFDRFKQVDESTSRKFGGSGLGLSICKELALLLGGSIDVKSELNKGSTFTVVLPKYLEKEYIKTEGNTINIKEIATPVKPKIEKTHFNNRLKDILVVSDDYASFFTLFIALKKKGVNVNQQQSLEEAGLLLQSQIFDVLIFKYNSLDEMGLDLLSKAKSLNIKTMMISDEDKSIKNIDVWIKEENLENSLMTELQNF